jgi:putative transposase
MREHGLQPKMRRRRIATTDSDHNQPVYPNRAKDVTPDGPDRLRVGPTRLGGSNPKPPIN